MYIHIDDEMFWLDSCCFTEKLKILKKNKKINFKINLYDNQLSTEFDKKIKFIESLKVLGNIYVSKSEKYWWCFDDCEIVHNKISEDKIEEKSYPNNNSIETFFIERAKQLLKPDDIKKWVIELDVSYKHVWGTSKKIILDRELKFKKLFEQ